jgi:septum formation protein
MLFTHPLILASKSPRRQFLLRELGFNFEVHIKEVDESFSDDLKAEQIPLYLCEKKARAFDKELDDETIVITADTIVWINGQVLNKPTDHADAVRMLQMLSGNMHEVFTGVCLFSKHKTRTFHVTSRVFFKKLSLPEIEYYIEHFKPFDKAGAYGAQECLPKGMNPCSKEEINFLFSIGKTELIANSISDAGSGYSAVERIEGSYFNVMGLPIVELYAELMKF